MTSKTDLRYDRKVRTSVAKLPLAERYALAEKIGFPDGMPLNEADIRYNVRQLRGLGTGRDEILKALSPPDDPAMRRLGSLSPAEVGVIVAQEWSA